jgi:hypothetical protein
MKTPILLLSVLLGALPLFAGNTKSAPATIGDGLIDYGSPITASITNPAAGVPKPMTVEALVKQRISVLMDIVEITKKQYAAGQGH